MTSILYEITPCACMGPVHGEPFCPCEMERRGLPPSSEHVAALIKAMEELRALFKEGGVFSNNKEDKDE
jgi:hypothetical protein